MSVPYMMPSHGDSAEVCTIQWVELIPKYDKKVIQTRNAKQNKRMIINHLLIHFSLLLYWEKMHNHVS